MVVLGSIIVLYFSGREFASALASAGLSVVLPMSTRILLEHSWILALVMFGYIIWSCIVLRGQMRGPQATTHLIAGVLLTILLQA